MECQIIISKYNHNHCAYSFTFTSEKFSFYNTLPPVAEFQVDKRYLNCTQNCKSFLCNLTLGSKDLSFKIISLVSKFPCERNNKVVHWNSIKNIRR